MSFPRKGRNPGIAEPAVRKMSFFAEFRIEPYIKEEVRFCHDPQHSPQLILTLGLILTMPAKIKSGLPTTSNKQTLSTQL